MIDANGLLAPTHRIPLPFEVQDVASILGPSLARCPDREALVGRHARYTFRELDTAIDQTAHVLADIGLSKGDRLGMSLRNDPALVVTFLACQRLGIVWVGIGRHLAPREKSVILNDSGARLYIGTGEDITRVSERFGDPGRIEMLAIELGGDSNWSRRLKSASGRAPIDYEQIDPWAPAAIAYTSGTTGTPKGAVISQHAMLAVVAAPIDLGYGHQWDPTVRRGVTLPLTTLNLMIQGPFLAMLGGASTVCIDRPDAVGISEWIEREAIGAISAAPATILDLLTDPAIPPSRLETIQSIVAGGGNVPERVRQLFRERFGVPLSVGYGLTEAPAALTSLKRHDRDAPGGSGAGHGHVELAILDEAGEPVAAGKHGEVCVRATQTGPWAHVYTPMLGYWRRPESTMNTIGDGWLHTGDIGSLDEDGTLFIHARRKEVIIRGGSNVYPAEVEQVIATHHGVAACAVIARPDERLGEVVAAVVQPRAGAGNHDGLEAELQALCISELAKYKIPVFWLFVDSMPLNGMNKIVKTDLAALFLSSHSKNN